MQNFFTWTLIITGCFFLVFGLIMVGEGTPGQNSRSSNLALLTFSIWMISLGLIIKKKERDTVFHIVLFIFLSLLLVAAGVLTNISKSMEPGDKTLTTIENGAALSQTILIIIMSLILVFFIARGIVGWYMERDEQSASEKRRCPQCGHRFVKPRIMLITKSIADRFGENAVQCPKCNHIF